MTCSARSLGSASSSRSSAASAAGVAPRGRVPAMGRSVGGAAFEPHVHLGRRADEVERVGATGQAGEVEEEHVGRRVQAAQAAVDVERLRAGLPGEALRKHDLEDVAGRDVLLGRLNRGTVLVRAHIRRKVRAAVRERDPVE